MAVLDSLPGLEVSVSVAATKVPEYECRDEEPHGLLAYNSVLRYIESVSDAEFVLNFQVSPPYQFNCAALNFVVYVDGHHVKGVVCEKIRVHNGHWAHSLLGRKTRLRDGSVELRKFRFASIKTVEDADSLRIKSDAIKFSKVGQITVKVFRISAVRHINKAPSHHRFKDKVITEVAEKALKGKSLSHCTAYSAPVQVTSSGTCELTHLDGLDNPIAIFNLRYLSKEALRQQLIIPRSPSVDTYDALTGAKKERLGRQKLAELEASHTKAEVKAEKKIKRERDTEGEVEIVDLSAESFASKVSARPYKMIRMLNGTEAIDLTD